MNDWHGDFTTKGRDYDTELIGEITDEIIDADRLCRLERRNGFPNFDLYRLVIAGDTWRFPAVRAWWVLFSIEWCRNHMRRGFSEELATVAAWDSLRRVMRPNDEPLSGEGLAEDLGVTPKTYRRVSDTLHVILTTAMRDYWGMLGAMYRIVLAINRRLS